LPDVLNEDSGNSSLATDRYYRSARSLFESGQLARARDLTDRALPLAAASHQSDLQRQVQRLKAEIEPANTKSPDLGKINLKSTSRGKSRQADSF